MLISVVYAKFIAKTIEKVEKNRDCLKKTKKNILTPKIIA